MATVTKISMEFLQVMTIRLKSSWAAFYKGTWNYDQINEYHTYKSHINQCFNFMVFKYNCKIQNSCKFLVLYIKFYSLKIVP